MFKSKRQWDGSYYISHTEEPRFGRIIKKSGDRWLVLCDVTGEDVYGQFETFKTKRKALWAVKCDF